MRRVICNIALRTNNMIRTNEPGVTVELFAQLLGCGLREAAIRFSEYCCFDFHIDNKSRITIEGLLRSYAERASFEAESQLYFSTVDPIVKCDRGLVHVRDLSLSLNDVLSFLGIGDTAELILLFPSDAGRVFNSEDAGFDYRFHSRERGKHKEPHLHVTYKHEKSGVFSLIDGRMIEGDMPTKRQRFVCEKILENQLYLLNEWNSQTDGIEVDLNTALGSLFMQTASGSPT